MLDRTENSQVNDARATVQIVRAEPVGDMGATLLILSRALLTLAPCPPSRPGRERGHLLVGGVAVPGPERPARGQTDSRFSDNQVAAAVRYGRRVTFHDAAGREVSGYFFGADAYRWGVVTPELATYLVPKSSVVYISSESTYGDEPRRPEMERLVGPYRERLLRDHYGQTASPAVAHP